MKEKQELKLNNAVAKYYKALKKKPPLNLSTIELMDFQLNLEKEQDEALKELLNATKEIN